MVGERSVTPLLSSLAVSLGVLLDRMDDDMTHYEFYEIIPGYLSPA